jgi:predicted ATPase/transcriptional regulator with XRE-family HTH domain
MQEQSNFGALLKRYRLAAGLSQEALAARASLSARTISDLERGIHDAPRSDTLELLTSALALTDQQRTLLLVSARPKTATFVDTPSHTHTLDFPVPPTRLVGRERERSYTLELLRHASTRLLTLTGPSGVGKTRFALQLIQDIAPDFGNGVAFIGLAPVRDAALVTGAIAQGLGIRESADTSLAEQVRVFLRPKHLLLVLDNVEQVLDSASFVADLLANCPHLFILATSRTPLRLRAEQEVQLAPLPLKDAVTLFCERANSVRPAQVYAVSEVAAICEQVDRLPLAIELAAMHVKLLPLSELHKRLTHRLTLLRDGARDLPKRQQTMEDAISWSYELLTEEQQRCFRALGVFPGGWTLEAAEEVCRDRQYTTSETFVLILAALADASLVQVEIPTEGRERFGMLELIREYALERLRAAGEEELCRRRHAAYYARLAETVMSYFGTEQGARESHFALTLELPNARAALEWAEKKNEAELGLRLAGFTRLWHVRGQMSEAEQWMERMLALDRRAREQGGQTAPLTLRITMLYGFGRTQVRHGRVKPIAQVYANEALHLARSIGDQNGMCNAYATLGMIAQANGKLDEAERAFTDSYTLARQLKHSGLIGRAMAHLSDVASMRGDVERATALLEEALANARVSGMVWDIPIITTMLGQLATQQQHSDLAKARYREALVHFRPFSSPSYIAWCLEGYAAALSAEGHYTQATRICAAAAALREQIQAPLPQAQCEAFEQTVATARAALDEASFAREWNAGTLLTQEEAIDYALSEVGE